MVIMLLSFCQRDSKPSPIWPGNDSLQYHCMGRIFKASEAGRYEEARYYIRTCLQVDAIGGQYGLTTLMTAAIKGDLPIAKLLLEEGADVDAIDEDGATAIFYAVLHGHYSMVELFLLNGARVERTSVGGLSPEFLARERGDVKLLALLAKYK